MATNIKGLLIGVGLDSRAFSDGLSKAQKNLQNFSATASVAGFRLGAAFTATFGVIGAAVTKIGSDFEVAFTGIRKTLEGTPEQFDALQDSIFETAKATGFASAEIADLARIGGQLGVEVENIGAFTDTIVKLSIAAAELDPEKAARGLARLGEVTGEKTVAEMDKLANVLAFLGDKLPTTEDRILDFTSRVSGMANAAQLSGEEILGLSAGFSAIVPQTERGASAVEKFLESVSQAVAKGGDSLESFADLAQMSMEDFSESFNERPAEAISAIINGLGNVSKDGLAPLLDKFDEVGIKGVRMVSTFAATSGAVELFNKSMKAATEEQARFTKLQEGLDQQLATVSAQFGRLRAALEEVAFKLFDAFGEEIQLVFNVIIDKFVPALGMLVDKIAELPSAAKLAALGMIALIPATAGVLVVLGQISGAIVSVISLAGKMKEALTLLGGASNALGPLATQMGVTAEKAAEFNALFAGSEAAAATASTSKLAAAFGTLKSAVAAIGPPVAAVVGGILSGVKAMDLASERAAALEGGFSNAAEAAVASVGTITKAWEGVKFVFQLAGEGIGFVFEMIGTRLEAAFTKAFDKAKGIVKGAGKVIEASLRAVLGDDLFDDFINGLNIAGKAVSDFFRNFTPDALAIAFDELGDQATVAAEELLRIWGKFPPAVQEVTAAQRHMADELGVTITVMDTAQTAATKLLRAAQEQGKAVANTATDAERAADAHRKLAMATGEAIDKMLQSKKVNDDVAEAAKFLGKSVDDLTAAAGDNLDEFVKLALQRKADADAAEKAAKANEELAESLKSLTVEGAVEEFQALGAQLDFAKEKGLEFTDEAIAELGAKIIELSNTARQDLTPAMWELLKAWDANKEAAQAAAIRFNDVNDALKKLRKETTKNRKPFDVSETDDFNDDLSKRTQDALDKINADILKDMNEDLKQLKFENREWNEALAATADIMQILGIESDSAFAQIIGGFTTAAAAGSALKEQVQQAKIQFKELKDERSKQGKDTGFFDFLKEGGAGAGIQMGQSILTGAMGVIEAGAAGGIKGALGGALAGGKLGADIGGMFGPIGSIAGGAIGAGIGAAISLIRGKPEFVKIMEDIGRDWGVEISEELAKQIEETAERLDLGRFEARLLSLGDIIGEAGGVGQFGLENTVTAVNDLMNVIASGAVPAAEGIEELGTVFGQMAEEMFEAGTVADAAMLQVIDRARQLGLEVPEIANFISGQLAQAASGISAIIGTAMEDQEGFGDGVAFGGIQVASLEDAQAQATIFAAGFFATLEEEGLRAAVDAFGPAFGEMKKKFEEFGSEVNFGGVQRFFDIAQDPRFGPLLDGVQGLQDAMTGLANSGFLTAETFGAFQQQASAAFDQLVGMGLDAPEALQQIAPFLQEAINASQTFGFELDENTQSLIDQAEAAGIGFATDPMQQMVDILALVAEQLGVTQEALAGVGVGAQSAGTAMDDALGAESMEERNAGLDMLGARSQEAFNGMVEGARQAGSAIGESIGSGADMAGERGMEAAQSVEETWAAATEAFGAGFDEQTTKITDDYAMVDEATLTTGEAVVALGENALSAAAGFDQMAAAARAAAAAASAAANAGGGPPVGPGTQAGQFGLTTTVSEPTTFIAGEAGEETVTIDPGGGPAPQGNPGPVVIQIDGKTIGKVLGDLSRTGDVRIHPSAVKDFG